MNDDIEPKKGTTRFGALCSCFSRKKNTTVENDDENELLDREDGESEEEGKSDENANGKESGSQAE